MPTVLQTETWVLTPATFWCLLPGQRPKSKDTPNLLTITGLGRGKLSCTFISLHVPRPFNLVNRLVCLQNDDSFPQGTRRKKEQATSRFAIKFLLPSCFWRHLPRAGSIVLESFGIRYVDDSRASGHTTGLHPSKWEPKHSDTLKSLLDPYVVRCLLQCSGRQCWHRRLARV